MTDGLFARVERLFDVEAFRDLWVPDRRLRVGRRSSGASTRYVGREEVHPGGHGQA